jgi:hypothetical protein
MKHLFMMAFGVALVSAEVAHGQIMKMAGNWTGAQFRNLCVNTSLEARAACVVYLLGVLDALRATKNNVRSDLAVCEPPGEVTADKWLSLIRSYLDDHEAELQDQAAVLVVRIINQGFPCR